MKISRLSVLAFVACLGMTPALAQDGATGAPATYNETRLSALEDQMRAINGRVEQVEYAVRRLDATLQRMQTDQEARLSRLEAAAAAPPPPPVVQPIPVAQPQAVAPPADPNPNGTLGALKMQDGRVTGGTVNPQASPLPNTPADYGLTPQEQYERAFAMLRQADYANAEIAFKAFIDKNPKDKLIDNAKYWYGETLYVRTEFDAAAVAFADAYQQNPQGSKAPDSLLKLAMSLAALNKIPDACVTLTELKTKYPSATAAIKSRADDERSHLKCPAH